MDFGHSLSLSDRMILTLDGLFRAVAARIAGGALAASLIVLICGRVRRVERRILGLLARFQAGRLRFRAGVAGRGGAAGRKDFGPRLPRGFGWLLALVPQHAAGFGSQLRGVLGDPEMVALLGACPQARRVLAPLCRMLGIEAELLGARPERRARVRPERPPRVARARPAPPPEPWRVPLPRGVLAAARRQGFGKLPRG